VGIVSTEDVEADMDTRYVPVIDQDACIACGLCVALCPGHVVDLQAQNLVLAHPEACTYCGLCEETCPVGAIALPYIIVWDTDISSAS
jgi:NAD-dependent dihydropyrimidine dehydrogenase PreA subunit